MGQQQAMDPTRHAAGDERIRAFEKEADVGRGAHRAGRPKCQGGRERPVALDESGSQVAAAGNQGGQAGKVALAEQGFHQPSEGRIGMVTRVHDGPERDDRGVDIAELDHGAAEDGAEHRVLGRVARSRGDDRAEKRGDLATHLDGAGLIVKAGMRGRAERLRKRDGGRDAALVGRAFAPGLLQRGEAGRGAGLQQRQPGGSLRAQAEILAVECLTQHRGKFGPVAAADEREDVFPFGQLAPAQHIVK